MSIKDDLLKKTLNAAHEGVEKTEENSAPKYMTDEGREVVKAILESVVEQNRWAKTGIDKGDNPTVSASTPDGIEKTMDNLNRLAQGKPLEISLVSKSLDVIAYLKIDQDGTIVSSKPNNVAPESYSHNMYDNIMEAAEKKLGKPVEGYETFNYDQRESFVKTSEGYSYNPSASFNDYSFDG